MALVIIDRGFYYFFRNKVFNTILSGETGGSLNYLIKYKLNTDFLILGTSRAVKQINPDILFDGKLKGYNAGIHGVGEIIYNDILLDIILNKGAKPKIIILQIDLTWFFNKKIDNKELIVLYPFINSSKRLQHYIAITNYEERTKLFFRSYQFNGKVLNVIKNYFERTKQTDNNGFDPSPCTPRDSINTIMTANSAKKSGPVSIDSIRMNALVNIIQNCKNKNIKLIIVQPPSFSNILLYDQCNKIFKENIERKYKVPFIDFSYLPEKNVLNDPKLWRDAYHLNIDGADIFSEMLNDSINKIN